MLIWHFNWARHCIGHKGSKSEQERHILLCGEGNDFRQDDQRRSLRVKTQRIRMNQAGKEPGAEYFRQGYQYKGAEDRLLRTAPTAARKLV